MPIGEDLFFAVTYDNDMAKFYIDGKEVAHAKKNFLFECGGGVDIGFYKASNAEYFNGVIYYLEYYLNVFTPKNVVDRFTKGPESPDPE